MKKYIDAERLRTEIESIHLFPQRSADYNDGREDMKMMMLDIIDSLQQEQSEEEKGKFVFPKFLYARTTNNKTIDISYGPQSLNAVEYVRIDTLQQECIYGRTPKEREKYCKFCSAVCNARVEQEQPEVDLEKEIDFFLYGTCTPERFPNTMQVRDEHTGLKVND